MKFAHTYLAKGVLAACLPFSFPCFGAEWIRTIPVRSQAITELIPLNGKFLLLDRSFGNGFVSEDGKTWTSFPDTSFGTDYPDAERYRALNGQLYAFFKDRIHRSPDGIHWTRIPEPAGCELKDLEWANGGFVGVSLCSENVFAFSPDGLQWEKRKHALGTGFQRILQGNGVFVAMSWKSLASSPDGVDWTIRRLEGYTNPTEGLKEIAFGNGRFVAIGWDGKVLTSTNGVSWSDTLIEKERTGWNWIRFHGNRFFAQSNGEFQSSSDGWVWKNQTVKLAEHITGIVYGNGMLLATNGKGDISVSEDSAKSWTEYKALTGAFKVLVHTDRGYLAVGEGGMLTTSPDALHWTERPADTLEPLRGAAWGAGKAVIVGSNGLVRTSTDLVQWTTQVSGTSDHFLTLTYGNSVFVATTYLGNIHTSSDGVTWTLTYDSPSGFDMRLAGFGNGTFLVPDNMSPGTLLTSPDGRNWTVRQHPEVRSFFSSFLAFGGDRFLIGYIGNRGIGAIRDTLYSTTDGTSMKAVPLALDYNRNQYFSYSVTFANGWFHALAADGRRILSTAKGNGSTWTIDSSNIGHATFLVYADGKLIKVGTRSMSVTSQYDPSPVLRNPIRIPADTRARRITSQGLWLPSSWAGEGMVAEVYDAIGNVLSRHPLDAKDLPRRIMPPSAGGAYFLLVGPASRSGD